MVIILLSSHSTNRVLGYLNQYKPYLHCNKDQLLSLTPAFYVDSSQVFVACVFVSCGTSCPMFGLAL